ncbi:hypothetical protein GCM10010915_16450 [Microbacterium faecale]|uniref:Uncharacterized protein n=1 Tax=Microbacterium faecale TaxID=1804630 RepID=A0A917DFQ3_9MICO|nr:hypothetical protein GCM10010915_16450 [Microbacterium faecale]
MSHVRAHQRADHVRGRDSACQDHGFAAGRDRVVHGAVDRGKTGAAQRIVRAEHSVVRDPVGRDE